MELTINGETYNFKFGIKFLKEIDGQHLVEGPGGIKKAAGFSLKAASLMDGDVLALVDVLNVANKTEKPRISTDILEEYLDDEDTDIDAVFTQTMDFLSKSNACKSQIKSINKMIQKNNKDDMPIMFPATV